MRAERRRSMRHQPLVLRSQRRSLGSSAVRHRRIAATARGACEPLERRYPAQSEGRAPRASGAREDASSPLSAAGDAAEREARSE